MNYYIWVIVDSIRNGEIWWLQRKNAGRPLGSRRITADREDQSRVALYMVSGME